MKLRRPTISGLGERVGGEVGGRLSVAGGGFNLS